MCVTCPACWRVEVASALTGQVIDVLHVSSFNAGEALGEPSPATFVVASKDVNLLRATPGGALVYVRPLCGCDTRDAVFGGVVDKITMGPVTSTVGAYSIGGYLGRRNTHMPSPGADGVPWAYTDRPQTEVAASIVNRTIVEGGPQIVGVDGGSQVLRSLTVQPWDHPNVLDLLNGLAGMENGVEWEMEYTRSSAGVWSNRMVFRDRVGVDRNTIVSSRVHASEFSLDIDAGMLATRVRAVGSGSEVDQLEAYAAAPVTGFPLYDAVPGFKDEEDAGSLLARARGWLREFDQPIVRPSITLADAYDPCPIRLGDTITIDMCVGRTRYEARSRVVALGWEQGVDGPPGLTLDLLPVGDAGLSTVIVDTDADCGCEEGGC